MALAYREGESTAYKVIKETCEVMISVLMELYVKVPSEDEWKHISNNFLKTWNMPNCIGAIDGKHVMIQAPPNSESMYYNYKKIFSIVLMAACDSNYKFTLFHVGSFGSESDGGILSKSAFGKALYEGNLSVPKEKTRLPSSEIETNFYFVGDEAFQMSTNLMRPYPGRNLNEMKKIFNYRLSRAQRIIENTFGILVSRWRIFRKPICASPDTAEKLVVAAICLHNFLKNKNDEKLPLNQRYCSHQYVDRENTEGDIIAGDWRSHVNNRNLIPLPNGPHRAATDAYEMRDILASYFLTLAGEVPWQYEYIKRGQYNTS